MIAIAAAVVLFSGFGASSDRRLSISVTSDQAVGLQVFFDRGSGFSEAESGRVVFAPGSNTQSMPLINGDVRALRLDPEPPGRGMRLDKVVVESPRSGHAPVRLALEALRPLNEIASLEHTATGATVLTAPDAQDPQLLLPTQDLLPPARTSLHVVGRICQGILLLIFSVAVVGRLSRSRSGVPVPSLLFGAWLLMIAMAFTSTTTQSVHPDEFSHVAAARYYLGHWLPPAVDSPEIVDSYSAYGASYLNELDVVYLVAAKATQLWSGFGLDEVTALRMFNVLLFGVLLAIAWIRPSVQPAAMVLLLTPQLWYVFSYFNADAFALFLSLAVTMLFAAPDSSVSRFIDGERASRVAIGAFVIALGLLFISKRNYLPVLFTTGMMLAVRHLGLTIWGSLVGAIGAALLMFRLIAGNALIHMFPDLAALFAPIGLMMLALFAALVVWPATIRPTLRWRLYRLSALFALAILVALPRIVIDAVENGGPAEKSSLMSIAAEQYAQPSLKPSTIATDPKASYAGVHLAAKGATLSQVLGAPHEWMANSWYSMLGVYGYMSIFAPPPLYWLLSIGMLMLCIGMVGWAFAHSDARSNLVVAIAGIGLVALASILHSWANDFQAQGRYLLPSFTIIAAYSMSQPGFASRRWVSVSAVLCFAGSVLSFAGVALPALAGR